MAASTKVKKKIMIEALTKSLGVVKTACLKTGVNRNTHYSWLTKDMDYKKAVDDIQNIALDIVETELFKQIKRGEVSSTIFYLKTKGRKRGYVERIDIASPLDPEPTEFVLPNGRRVAI